MRVPQLNPLVWRYAIEDAGDGAMVWRDGDGQLVAFNMVHRSGTEGWMGPLAVRPDRQGEGLGSTDGAPRHRLAPQPGRARSIGLETMPRTVDNIGFYSRTRTRAGAPHGHAGPRRAPRAGHRATRELLSQARSIRGAIEDCRQLTQALLPGVDFTRELALTRELGIGDATLVRDGRRAGRRSPSGTRRRWPRAARKDELRVLKLVARDLGGLRPAARRACRCRGRRRAGAAASPSAVRPNSPRAYLRLVSRGYRVHWTDLRMTLEGYPRRDPVRGVVMSNWEI